MPHMNFDPTKVRIFPEYPEEELRRLWEVAADRQFSQNPELTAQQRKAVILRRFQEWV